MDTGTKPTESQRIRDWLSKRIADSPPMERLPSNRQIARHLSVSPMLVQKVYREFEGQGRIARVPKKGTYSGGPPIPMEAASSSSAGHAHDDIHDRLLELIAPGAFPGGTQLPGYKALCAQFRVSRSTVFRALQRLVAANHITRRGRGYIVGRLPTMPAYFSNTLFVVLKGGYLAGSGGHDPLYSPIIAPFYVGLYRELNRCAVPVEGFVIGKAFGDDSRARQTGRWKQLRQMLKSSERKVVGLSLNLPCGDRRMMAVIDAMGVPYCICQGESESPLPFQLSNGITFRVEEDDLCHCLVESAYALGHRHFAFVSYDWNEEWVRRRYATLSEQVASIIPDGTIVSLSMRRLFERVGLPADSVAHEMALSPLPSDTVIQRLDETFLSAKRKLPSFAGKLIGPWREMHWSHRTIALYSAVLAQVRRYPSVTALVFPNDACADDFDEMLDGLRFRIPDDYGLFSFDNFQQNCRLRTSTVDRGFEQLGARAARYFAYGKEPGFLPGATIRSTPRFIRRTGSRTARTGKAHFPKGLEALA